jgi:glycerol-3-phosphate dehydrogenase
MRLLKQHRLIDHAPDGIAQAITVVSVKFTTARRVAEDVVAHVTGSVRRKATALTLPLPGRPTPAVGADTVGTQAGPGQRLATSVTTHIARSYGARYAAVIALSDRIDGGDRCVSPEAPVTFGQLVYSARNEMVHTVDDLLWRRTELGARGLVTPPVREEAQRALDLAATLL